MKTAMVLATVGLLTTSTLSVAQSDIDCGQLGEVAAAIMISRQKEMPMSQVMGIVGDNELLKQMVRTAYSEPSFSSEEYRTRAIGKFRNFAETQCFAAQGRK